ncbi:DMT family transporter [Nocardioides guangzhouensis]|uniref:DMT family transporter n=1 Tax=Nocardioides guangzhouensis TaxID=2497878 RepID=A0A4V1XZ68_9ACTN|nr:DMT family transporter [Nocardioides guangzhouensis]RYP85699.1 DMT family transporter [Nocardioides guangzhouensis]
MRQVTAGRLATLALLVTTATWGSTFFLIKDLSDRIPAIDFLAIRFPIATVALFLIFPRALRSLSPESRRQAAVLGALYAVAQVLQTIGLAHTAASVSGFITGLYVVCTPLLAALLLGNRIGSVTWFAVALAMAGVGLLTLQPGGLAFGYGETLTLVAAVIYALHIVGLGAWSRPHEAMGMSVVQLAVISVICLVGAAPGGIVLPETGRDWLSVVYMAVFAGALAMAFQTWAQAHLTPTRSAIIMSMEPVFAAFFAVLAGGEELTLRLVVGGLLVLSAMLIVELLPRRRIEAEVTHIAV